MLLAMQQAGTKSWRSVFKKAFLTVGVQFDWHYNLRVLNQTKQKENCKCVSGFGGITRNM
jgi:hypothetical protein